MESKTKNERQKNNLIISVIAFLSPKTDKINDYEKPKVAHLIKISTIIKTLKKVGINCNNSEVKNVICDSPYYDYCTSKRGEITKVALSANFIETICNQ